MIFILKDKEDLGQSVVSREPSNLRTLSLSGNDAKIVARALARPLNLVAPHCVHESARGGIADRQMLTNILQLESRASQDLLRSDVGPGYIFWDFKAAFPSIAWSWLFPALLWIGVPQALVAAIKELYHNADHAICVCGRLFGVADYSAPSSSATALSRAAHWPAYSMSWRPSPCTWL